MATMTYGVAPRTVQPGGARATGYLGSLIQAIRSEWQARRAARSVEALSDEMLHDIGVARSEIDLAVRNGRPTWF